MIDADALPKVRKPTPKQQKEIDAVQAEMAQRFDASGRKFDRAYAILNELNAFPREDWSRRQYTQYVDALVELGEFETAYELTGDKEYKSIVDAINNPQPMCECRDYESVELVNGKKKTVKHSRLFVKRVVWNVKTGKDANVMTCNVCGRSYI
jgi:hypothetical protein